MQWVPAGFSGCEPLWFGFWWTSSLHLEILTNREWKLSSSDLGLVMVSLVGVVACGSDLMGLENEVAGKAKKLWKFRGLWPLVLHPHLRSVWGEWNHTHRPAPPPTLPTLVLAWNSNINTGAVVRGCEYSKTCKTGSWVLWLFPIQMLWQVGIETLCNLKVFASQLILFSICLSWPMVTQLTVSHLRFIRRASVLIPANQAFGKSTLPCLMQRQQQRMRCDPSVALLSLSWTAEFLESPGSITWPRKPGNWSC